MKTNKLNNRIFFVSSIALLVTLFSLCKCTNGAKVENSSDGTGDTNPNPTATVVDSSNYKQAEVEHNIVKHKRDSVWDVVYEKSFELQELAAKATAKRLSRAELAYADSVGMMGLIAADERATGLLLYCTAARESGGTIYDTDKKLQKKIWAIWDEEVEKVIKKYKQKYLGFKNDKINLEFYEVMLNEKRTLLLVAKKELNQKQ